MKNENIQKPTPEDFGWYSKAGFDDIESGWVYEGGEEAYYEALAKWNESKILNN